MHDPPPHRLGFGVGVEVLRGQGRLPCAHESGGGLAPGNHRPGLDADRLRDKAGIRGYPLLGRDV